MMKISEAMYHFHLHMNNPDYIIPVEASEVAYKALQLQIELGEYSGEAVCYYHEDYDYDENDISEYWKSADVDEFLLDELKYGN